MGCGQLGSRHLQGLTKIPFESTIDVVEPNIDAIKIAKDRIKEINYKKLHKINWMSNLNNVSKNDLVIVATLSNNRRKIVERLLSLKNSRFILEKIVTQSSSDYKILMKKIENAEGKAWVNTSRRYFNDYQKLFKKIQGDECIDISVNAGDEGLGSNAIHFLDVFLWFNKSKKLKLNGKNLESTIIKNKRGNSFVEFRGKISGVNENNSKIEINFRPYKNSLQVLEILSEKNRIIIDETNGREYDLINKKNRKFKMNLQSDLTKIMVEDIFKKDDSKLPKLDELENIHYELFRIFNNHLKKISGKEYDFCPIT